MRPTIRPTRFLPSDYPDRRVDEVRGIGRSYTERLRAGGITNLAELASMEPARLARMLDVSEVKAMSFIDEARRLLVG
ncbi:MAG: helix-hairpin-helix domain-containing protein [Deltaproteobacteria bacterium]|nr:helix-hairpin-helix domain-containing protein [Deltaproteobacteria bacterium]